MISAHTKHQRPTKHAYLDELVTITSTPPLAEKAMISMNRMKSRAYSDMTGQLTTDGKRLKTFTWKELSVLNQRHNAHIAYKGNVYDVSSFIAKHPGGAEQLLYGAGKDITHIFDSYHSPKACEVMRKYLVGKLSDSEFETFDTGSEFYGALKEKVSTYFKASRINPKADPWMFFRMVNFFLLALICWGLMIAFHSWTLLATLLALSWGFFSAMVAMSINHDAGHFAITHKPWVWKWAAATAECLIGTSTHIWIYQHTFGHHTYPNVDGADPDVRVHKDKPDFWRIVISQKWTDRYMYQHIYMPCLYCLLGIKMRLQDFHSLFVGMKGTVRLNPPTSSQLAVFFVAKVVHCVIRFAIPSFYLSIGYLLYLNLVYDLIYGFWLAIITQVNHISDAVVTPGAGTSHQWAEMQLAATMDYATDSWFWTVFSGALNHQVAHHLFPGVLQSHYSKITPIIKQTCAEYGLQYRYARSGWDALCLHIGHLRKMGQKKL